MIRSEAVEGDSRARHYRAEDIEVLVARRSHRRNPDQVAQKALDWGAPVIYSALTLIDGQRLYYRGQDVLQLAVTERFEHVAALLWTGDGENAASLFTANRPPVAIPHEMMEWPDLPVMTRLTIGMSLTEAHDLAAHDLRPTAVVRTGVRLLDLAVAILGAAAGDLPIAERLAMAWSPNDPTDSHTALLINAALIVCADHELNASSFTARVVASTEPTLYGVVVGGLAALQGVKHGGGTGRALALLEELQRGPSVYTAMADRLRRGETLPGFGHRLYPDGDPRAKLIFNLLHQYCPQSTTIRVIDQLTVFARESIDQPPNVDLALAALAQSMNWPGERALALFALGRMAGWVGHALEQYAVGQLIRPRAAYTGSLPVEETE
jgi:citrate synthase